MVETPPADELGTGAPAAPSGRSAAVERTASGQVANREAAAALGALGGLATKAKREAELRMLTSFGLEVADVPEALVSYLDRAQEWCEVEVARVRTEVGGGVASTAVCALIQQAGLALAHSRHATAEGRHGDAVKYGTEVRANVLAAHHLAALEAKARATNAPRAEEW